MEARVLTMSTATHASVSLGLREPTVRTTSMNALRGENCSAILKSHKMCACGLKALFKDEDLLSCLLSLGHACSTCEESLLTLCRIPAER